MKTPNGQLPAVQYSIADAMIKEGKCVGIGRPLPCESNCGSSPCSSKSEESLTRSSSVTSVNSCVQDRTMPTASSQAQGAQLESGLTTSVCQANRSDTLLDFDRDDNVLDGIPQSEQATYEQGTHGV